MKKFLQTFALLAIGLSLTLATPAAAQIRLFNPSGNLPANDDGSTGLVGVGFALNFFGTTYNNLYINNNGNVTFTAPLGLFNPSQLNLAGTPIIAPFLSDVDTRGPLSSIVEWGYRLNVNSQGINAVQGSPNKRDAFVVNWMNVGYFGSHDDLLNQFQLVIIDRGDVAPGDFDFEFNYANMLWDTGDASGGTMGGCIFDPNTQKSTGDAARVGWSNGAGTNFEQAGSGVCGALVNGGSDALISGNRVPVQYTGNNQNNAATVTTQSGRYLYSVRNGVVDGVVPEPMTFVLMGTGLIGVGLVQIRRRRQNEEV